MKTIDIKGKQYVTVNERLKEFRNNFKDYSLITEIIELGTDFATVKASIIDNNGVLRATGFAREVVAKSPINKYAFLENCETSAVGRALGNFGIGIDEAVCTADELIQKLSYEPEKKEKSEFEKEAIKEKSANTRAINKAIKEGATELTPKPLTKEELKNKFNTACEWLDGFQKLEQLNNTQIDAVNNLLSNLFQAELEEEYNILLDKYNNLQQLDDTANI